jgi:diphosphomevalonate decarboxylase
MKVEASAPSNIALIKYMGKTAAQGNLPTNASLSYAAEHLRTFVTIEDGTGEDGWQPLEGFPVLQLSEFGQQKFLNHFRRLKKHWGIEGSHTVRSANNFPSDCGLASSASSFAALTLATRQLTPQSVSLDELSRLSRQGSGSSCRCFF